MNYKETLIQLSLTVVIVITINLGIALSFMHEFNELPETRFVLIISGVLFSGVFLILRCFTFLPNESKSQSIDNVMRNEE